MGQDNMINFIRENKEENNEGFRIYIILVQVYKIRIIF